MFKPLNDLFAKAVNYKTYRLERRSSRYDKRVARRIGRLQKRLDVQMKPHTFSCQERIAILGFLARFQTACDETRDTEGEAVWCFQFFLIGQAHSLL